MEIHEEEGKDLDHRPKKGNLLAKKSRVYLSLEKNLLTKAFLQHSGMVTVTQSSIRITRESSIQFQVEPTSSISSDELAYIYIKFKPSTTDNKEIQKTINDRLYRNSSNAEIFHASKIEYEAALKNSGYKNVDFKYNLAYKNNNKRNRQRNIIWFNPPFSQAVSTNVAK